MGFFERKKSSEGVENKRKKFGIFKKGSRDKDEKRLNASSSKEPITPTSSCGSQEEYSYKGNYKTKDGDIVMTAYNAGQYKPSNVRGESSWDAFGSGEDYSDSVDESHEDGRYSRKGMPPPPPRRDNGIEHKELKKSKKKRRQRVVLKDAPTAKESAYQGPPRYDWIDIETSAAVKVQAAYRRSMTMDDLERRGLTTAAHRNRIRERKSRKTAFTAGEDVPELFRFCGIGLLFGDATGEDRDEVAAREKAQWKEQQAFKNAKESQKRQFKMRKGKSNRLMESVEVVD